MRERWKKALNARAPHVPGVHTRSAEKRGARAPSRPPLHWLKQAIQQHALTECRQSSIQLIQKTWITHRRRLPGHSPFTPLLKPHPARVKRAQPALERPINKKRCVGPRRKDGEGKSVDAPGSTFNKSMNWQEALQVDRSERLCRGVLCGCPRSCSGAAPQAELEGQTWGEGDAKKKARPSAGDGKKQSITGNMKKQTAEHL